MCEILNQSLVFKYVVYEANTFSNEPSENCYTHINKRVNLHFSNLDLLTKLTSILILSLILIQP